MPSFDRNYTIPTPDGSLNVRVYDDGNVWMTHPGTGFDVGCGRLEDDERTPFVHINTEGASEPEIDGNPQLHIALNDADVYEVTSTGATPDSTFHRAAARDALRAVHRLLFPERYDPTAELYQWDSGTAEAVAELVVGLAEAIGAPLAAVEQTYPSGCVDCLAELPGFTLTKREGDVVSVNLDGKPIKDGDERTVVCPSCGYEQDVVDEAAVAGHVLTS